MKHQYVPHGVCSRLIEVELDGDTIQNVRFVGGCAGNTQGVAALVKGRSVDEVVGLLENIRCGGKDTSCPAQLSKALLEAIQLQD